MPCTRFCNCNGTQSWPNFAIFRGLPSWSTWPETKGAVFSIRRRSYFIEENGRGERI